ncbi:MAG TPA: N-6 DNA methylase [Vicinamibacterales bacterium]|nr:N-6 DNA methylase [Vicinamibacterales bacterium]
MSEQYVEACLADRARIGGDGALRHALGRWGVRGRTLGPASAVRAIVDVAALPLAQLLGFAPAGRVWCGADRACITCQAGSVPVLLLVVPWGAALNRFRRDAVVEGGRAGAPWCLLFNGTHLRLIRLTQLHSRRYAELELDATMDDERSAAALAMLFHARALGQAHGPGAVSTLIAEAERHASGVCRSLRTGVLDASGHVLGALLARAPQGDVHGVFDQALTIVYRLLFLFFAEARALVPLWHPVYRDSYSVEGLRMAALAPDSVGLWDALRAASRLAHVGCAAGDLKVTAFNGRLFSPARTPLAERRGLDDRAIRRAIVAVATRAAADGEGREPISYRDLGVEQLGAVYETLLDYVPHVERSPRGRPLHVALRTGSGVRKATGTFYTPQPLVDYLVRDALAPLVRDTTPERILERRVLDPSMGSGAFLVSACRYLADAYEAALIDFGRCHASDIGARERAAIRRLVAERCLFGVDINPTAVQLARLSLWLTTLAADRPLSFLDHHLRVGNSLAGAWLSRLRTAPSTTRGASVLPLFEDEPAQEAVRGALPVRFALASGPNDTAAQVRAKEQALATLAAPGSPLATWTRIADTWCAAWLASPPVPANAFADLSSALLGHPCALPESARAILLGRVNAAASARRLFHWELEFPELFFDESGSRRADGGFDAVLGNPPWDMLRADGDDRAASKADGTALVRFARDSGVYETRPEGQANKYQLFVERAVALTRPGGRLGLVLPAGIVADSGSAPLRRLLFSRCAVERIVGFDNRSATFPIHRSVKFVLMSAGAGDTTREIACRFGETSPAALEDAATEDGRPAAAWFTTRLTPALLARISGDDLSIPDVRSPLELAIVERAASLFAPVGSERGWHAHFGRELNATEDRPLLKADGHGVPVLEGKLIEPFRCAPDGARWHMAASAADRVLGGRWRHARLAYRDVASPTNRLTLIAALLPAGTVTTHTLFCLKDPLSRRAQQVLAACFNSFVVNFLVRLRVSTHVTTGIVERLPVPREDQMGASADELAALAERLSRRHQPSVAARLNAIVARLYQLDADEFSHVLSTFPLIDRSERDLTLEHFHRA